MVIMLRKGIVMFYENIKRGLTLVVSLSFILGAFSGCGNDKGVLTEKEGGHKYELTEKEKKYFEQEFGDKYKIIGQVGKTGQRTSAYLMEDKDKEKYILKIPNSEDEASEWIENQKKVDKLLKETFVDYTGEVNIPQYLEIGDKYVVEKYLGEDLEPELYDELSDEEKDKITRDMAEFLVYLHNKHRDGDNNRKLILDETDEWKSLQEIFEHVKSRLTETEQKDLLEKINKFKNRDKSDEVVVLTHGDIRSQNMLYDKDTKKVAFIDFELMEDGNVYNDFIPAASFGLTYELLFNIIDYYNKESEFKIDKEKVELIHELSMWHEFGRVSILDNNKEFPKDAYDEIKERINSLEEAYQNNIDKAKN